MNATHAPHLDPPLVRARLAELVQALELEARHVGELREALVRQREAVATSQAEQVNATVDTIARMLVALEEARRRRGTLLQELTGDPGTRLEQLQSSIPFPLPASTIAARAALAEAAQGVAREVAINREVLRRAVEAGEAFLQALFSSAVEPSPCYGAGPAEEQAPGLLVNRSA
jgi:hypothetical protein